EANGPNALAKGVRMPSIIAMSSMAASKNHEPRNKAAAQTPAALSGAFWSRYRASGLRRGPRNATALLRSAARRQFAKFSPQHLPKEILGQSRHNVDLARPFFLPKMSLEMRSQVGRV